MVVHERLNELTAMVRNAKAMPMSASALVNRAEMLEILERLRQELPANLHHAQALLSDREAVLAAGREEAARILAGARAEREQLIEQADVLAAARARAAAVSEQSRAESDRLLADADDYVDRKLADFEVFLGQLASQVSNGRQRLTARRELDVARSQDGAPRSAPPGDGPPEAAAGSGTMADHETGGHQGPATADAPVGAR